MQQGAEALQARKGPRVFLDYTQSELDAAYDQAIYAPNRQQCQDRKATPQRPGARAARQARALRLWPERDRAARRLSAPPPRTRRFSSSSTAARGATGSPRTMPMRPRASRSPARILSCRISSPFRMPAAASFPWPSRCAAPLPGCTRTPTASAATRPGSISAAIPPARIWRAARLIADWAGEFGVAPDIIKGAMLCSGMYDLEPVRLSARSKYVAFTDAMGAALERDPPSRPHHDADRPRLRHAARRRSSSARGAISTPRSRKPARRVELIVGEHYNHFEMADTLSNPFGLLGRAVFDADGRWRSHRLEGAVDRHVDRAAARRRQALLHEIDRLGDRRRRARPRRPASAPGPT